MIRITLPDGNIKEIESPMSVLQFTEEKISRGLAKEALGGIIDGELVPLTRMIDKDIALSIFTFDSKEGEDLYRHTSSHILAQAVKRVFGKDRAKLGFGPSIKDGYYYDFDIDVTFTPEDLVKIEKAMMDIIKEDLPIERFVMTREEAIQHFKNIGEEYKIDLIEGIADGVEISFYRQGDFTDLCTGPHLPSTGYIKAVKLMSIAGAYWRGDEKNKMLQRIYGTSFPKQKLLDEYLNRLEEAKKRDHRKLGKELELFTIEEEGPGFPFFLPKGMILRNELENFWRVEHSQAGYHEIKTPVILSESLWHQSGHWDHFKENMYFTKIDEGNFAVKPMNCPGGMLAYKTKLHSYRDLPVRMGELGLVHRHEMSGALHGLMRVRCFTQDDAHLFMTEDQIKDELVGVINLIDKFYSLFGFNYHVELSTKPAKAMGSDEIWDKAISALREVLNNKGINYIVNEGDGAFYGPKIDFHIEDAIGRTWQCGTIQLDFLMPERFDLTYIGQDGEKHRPVMIHRVVFGSIERFIGILIEHFAGAFPLWLSPEQVNIITISEEQIPYGKEVEALLKAMGIRVKLDARNEKLGYKIREAQLNKTPYMLVIGKKEMEEKTASVRKRGEGDLGAMDIEAFGKMIKEAIDNKSI